MKRKQYVITISNKIPFSNRVFVLSVIKASSYEKAEQECMRLFPESIVDVNVLNEAARKSGKKQLSVRFHIFETSKKELKEMLVQSEFQIKLLKQELKVLKGVIG